MKNIKEMGELEKRLELFVVDILDYQCILGALKGCSALFCCLDSLDGYDKSNGSDFKRVIDRGFERNRTQLFLEFSVYKKVDDRRLHLCRNWRSPVIIATAVLVALESLPLRVAGADRRKDLVVLAV
ncbi:hypothetical protein MRB53_016081 [Persea americana]|uniref:Uncharacterized protein n=1 Tax=Persea americana TaxID=3435 RepID=A0ACC2M0X1_PERAE|nr:hypothetical protein MRB53_016081 [Persea americana]